MPYLFQFRSAFSQLVHLSGEPDPFQAQVGSAALLALSPRPEAPRISLPKHCQFRAF